MSIAIRKVGHVVLKVRDLERSVPFYRDILGLKEVARLGRQMVFFSAGDQHHDIGLLEVGETAPSPSPHAVGLYHVALKIGDRLEDLRRAKDHLESKGVPILGLSDHRVSQSIYIQDPDGNQIELYVDADPGIWKKDPGAVATVKPLEL